VIRRPSRDRRPPGPVKGPNDWTIESAFLRQDARATERLVDPDPRLATRMRPRERPRSGPTGRRVVVESAWRTSTLRCLPVRSVTLDRAPACAPAVRRRLGRRHGPRRPDVSQGRRGLQTSFSGLAAAYRSLQRMIRRAGTPASRESSSARGSRLVSALGGLTPPDPTVPLRTRGIRHLVSPATDVTIRCELCPLERWTSHRPGGHDRAFDSGREMTPRSHAV